MVKLREHVRPHTLWLEYPDHYVFYTPRVCGGQGRWYLAWRAGWALYLTCWLAVGLVDTHLDTDKRLDKWFAYLSHWTYLMLVVLVWLELVLVAARWPQVGTPADTPASVNTGPLPWYLKVVWMLSTVTSTACVMVTLWYWLWQAKGKSVTAVRLHFHGINAAYVIANMAVSRMPVRLLHFLYPVTFGFLYTIFTAIYYACEGTNQEEERYIYKVIDWSKPERTLVLSSISNCLFIPLVHALLWGLSLGLDKLFEKHGTHRHERMSRISCDSV